MRLKYLFAALIIILIFAFWIYHYLGGFDDIHLQTKNNVNITIQGENFSGNYGSRQNRLKVKYYRDLLEKKKVKGKFTVINYGRTASNKDSIRQFIGIQLNQASTYRFPDSLSTKKINASKLIEATITSHAFVRPSPEQVEKTVASYARSNNLKLADYSIEKYISPRKLVIYYPVKE